MSITNKIVVLFGVVFLILIATGIYCWYNKDRYQLTNKSVVFDKNTGKAYYEGRLVDFPNAMCVERPYKTSK